VPIVAQRLGVDPPSSPPPDRDAGGRGGLVIYFQIAKVVLKLWEALAQSTLEERPQPPQHVFVQLDELQRTPCAPNRTTGPARDQPCGAELEGEVHLRPSPSGVVECSSMPVR
jgi:hypothetical protein